MAPPMPADKVRDGKEINPEVDDLLFLVPGGLPDADLDEDLDEALMETFPASDPIASGRME
ncbi:hypothetical protein ELI55_27005 (plasmid) [Rhizobium ruizarguesonis]|uniref:hypothetical protein n=1 Tax=Rhizobium ruizarguesonis TaxID=2081791 RepID=UPI001030C074|nr:hypothetical protein [Rhizobium ruizarguesonis]TAT96165.1 hypothetical protein ELI55_27005 [Rhizobium ruizarguesonis]